MKKKGKAKKIKVNKKMLIILLAVVLAIFAIILIVNLVNKEEEKPETPPTIVQLPETTYSDMQVKNIVMELLKGNAADGTDQTRVSFEIVNTTPNKVQSQSFEAVLIGADGSEITRMPYNYIQELEVGEPHEIEVVYKGDLTATTQIKLIQE